MVGAGAAIVLAKDPNRSMVEQVADHFRAAIAAHRLVAGDRLPTIRDFADSAGVTRATVQQAYRRLAALGLVESTVGRGTQVIAGPATVLGPLSRAARAAHQHLQRSVTLPMPPAGCDLVANLADLLPDAELFPVAEFRAALDAVLRADGGRLLAYGDPAGSRELRTLLAERHGDADPARVLITSGAQQGIDLVLRTFTSPGDEIAVAIPTYHQLLGVAEAHGLVVAPVASRLAGPEPGIDVDDLARVIARPGVRLLYVMPTFHNPTGITLSREHRERLMSVVADTDVPVLEDEFLCDLGDPDDPRPSLASLDPRGLTATVRSFSKGLFPGARIGWVEAGQHVLGPMTALKQFADLESSPLLQAALLDFVRRGGMDRYLRGLRAELRARHVVAQRALREHLPPGCSFTDPRGGLALWIELPAGVDGEALAAAAAERGVRVTPGRVFDPSTRHRHGLRVSVARADAGALQRGIAVLGECVRLAVDARSAPTTNPPLFL